MTRIVGVMVSTPLPDNDLNTGGTFRTRAGPRNSGGMSVKENPEATGHATGDRVAQNEKAKSTRGVVLPTGRLDQFVSQIATLYRKAHLTAEEDRYVHKRARALARIRGRPPWLRANLGLTFGPLTQRAERTSWYAKVWGPLSENCPNPSGRHAPFVGSWKVPSSPLGPVAVPPLGLPQVRAHDVDPGGWAAVSPVRLRGWDVMHTLRPATTPELAVRPPRRLPGREEFSTRR